MDDRGATRATVTLMRECQGMKAVN